MGVTGSSAEVVYVTAEQADPDYDRPVLNEELVAALEARTRRLDDDERVDEDAYPGNAFGI
jgi:hypothetical protein